MSAIFAFQVSEQWIAKIALIDGADQSGEMAHAWKNKRLSLIDLFRRTRANRFGAEFLQRALDAGDVSRAVVDECDCARRHSNPFVLGSTPRSRLSRETAKRNARANALNSAST